MRWYQQGPNQETRTAKDSRDPYAAPMPISESQYRATFDRGYRVENPYLAGRDALGTSEAESRGGMDNTGFRIGQALQRRWAGLHGSDLSSLLTNGAIGATAGVGGVGLINAYRTNTGSEPLGWKSKLLAGLLGAGAGGLLTDQMRGGVFKNASTAWLTQSDALLRDTLVRQISREQDVDLSLRAKLTAAIARLGGSDLQALTRVAAMAAGAGIGAAVARWLMGKGLLSTVAGGILGGAAGFSFSRPSTNAFGRQSIDQYR